MKKFIYFLLCCFTMFSINAQVPQSINYQAVYNTDSSPLGLYKKNNVAVIVKILKETPDGETVLEEVHSTSITEKGLFSIQIGSIETNDFSLIDWSDGPFYLNVNVNGTDFGTSKILSVPYAMYAKESEDSFSGEYTDLANVPPEFNPSTHSHVVSHITDLSAVGVSGSYNDLTDVPSNFNPDAHSHNESDIYDLKYYTDDSISGQEIAFNNWDKDEDDDFDGNYNNLIDTPTEVSHFNNDAGYLFFENDADPTNEIQSFSVSINGDTLFISESNFVLIPNISQANNNPSYTAEESWFDSRNGEFYETVQIGSQIWMAENLNFKTSSSWYYDNDSLAYADTYGVLYNWNTAKVACPAGWHLPTESEINTLVSFLGGESVAGGKLKEIGLENWLSPNTGATDEFGFTALPGGDYNVSGDAFINMGSDCTFWINSEYDGISAYRVILHKSTAEIYPFQPLHKESGASVRCIKD